MRNKVAVKIRKSSQKRAREILRTRRGLAWGKVKAISGRNPIFRGRLLISRKLVKTQDMVHLAPTTIRTSVAQEHERETKLLRRLLAIRLETDGA